MKDCEAHAGLGLASMVKRGEVAPAQLLDAACERLARHNPSLNAVVTPLLESARKSIADGLPAGLFEGVPFLVKELVASVKGVATTSASRLYANNIAAADSEVVARMRRAGLLIIGKTNSSEFGLSPCTESQLYGITRNPWRRELSPGGSSGGSAAPGGGGIRAPGQAHHGGGALRAPAPRVGASARGPCARPTRGGRAAVRAAR